MIQQESMLIPTVNCLRVTDCEHDAATLVMRAKRKPPKWQEEAYEVTLRTFATVSYDALLLRFSFN